ncbi:hypothetical protein KY289_026083 [Solanum tuberosum]|nr:hypothetical protein KY289_026083 [Solanum tuberosum]
MASKSIIADLNKGEKLNGGNYDIWSHKIWYVLEEKFFLEGINHVLNQPEERNTAQQRRDLEAYKACKKANFTTRGIIVSSVVDDLIHECEKFPIAYAMWAYLRGMYGGTSVTHLRQLTIKFDTYKKCHDQNIKQHFRVMSNMITQLKSVGHVLSDEQQVQTVIRSLPNNWEHLKVNLTHNDNIKTFSDVTRHVELEDERLGAAKAAFHAFVAESSGTKSSGFKHSGSTDHVSRDRETFVEFHRVSSKSKWIYVGNNAKLEVKGICTCKVDLCGGRSLMYSERSKGYAFIDELEDRNITEIVSRDVRFLENDFPKKGEIDEVEPLYEMLNSENQIMLSNILDNSMDQEMIPGPSGSYESQNPIEDSELQIQLDEPNSVTDALSSPERDEWLKVTKEELESMKTNKVWDLVDLPK